VSVRDEGRALGLAKRPPIGAAHRRAIPRALEAKPLNLQSGFTRFDALNFAFVNGRDQIESDDPFARLQETISV
jgi:hypothetical protein